MHVKVTDTTILTAVMVCSVLMILAMLYLKKRRETFSRDEVLGFLAACIAIHIRLFLPLEFPFTYSVYLEPVYFKLCRVLNTDFYRSINALDVLIVVEICGILIVGTYKAIRYYRAIQFLQTAELVEILEVSEKRKIPVYRSKMVREPFIFGIWNTRIVLPYKTQTGMKYILLHEIQHDRNHDLILKLLFETAATICWWNPMIHMVKQDFYNMLELHTDFSVTQDMKEEEKIEYAATLVEAAKTKHSGIVGLGINSKESFLKCRVHSIFEKEKRGVPLFIQVLIAVSVCSLLVVVEPITTLPPEEGVFTLQEDGMYFIEQLNGYKLTIDGEEVGILDEIPKELEDISILEEEK